MDSQTLHLRKLSGSRAAFQTFVEETIKAGGQEIKDYHTLHRGVSLVTFPTRRTALEALTFLQAQLDTEAPQFRFDMFQTFIEFEMIFKVCCDISGEVRHFVE